MRTHFLLYIFSVILGVHAHFQLQFPPPRGPFVANNEPQFCDGFNDVTNNRTEFPLSGGFFTLVSEHPTWNIAVLLSTVDNPNNFNNFNQVTPFARATGEGTFCVPLDFSSLTNATGLTNGQNATIQILFDGGDSPLYQCADLTLRNDVSINSVSCTNSTGNENSGSSITAARGGWKIFGLIAMLMIRLM